ncbi:hypothetical protein EIP91_000404 [Steccherinum ochraceum]|uniref:Uncharacterized protein n=1 Tax=Steccherinum ochraceum TaxID=92696 RepID=A0A4R0RTL5_9APHY|nr:hypothetical protein EIP91_000404 [Steccherinum ochraceum]
MSDIPETFSVGSLYIAGFTQAAKEPHKALIIPTDTQSGFLVHIRIDRETSPNWTYQSRKQRIAGEMFLSSLLKIHDIAAGEITVDQLRQAATAVPVPDNDQFGECGPWLFKVIHQLHKSRLVTMQTERRGSDEAQDEHHIAIVLGKLAQEFKDLAEGSRAFARRERFPNVAVSQFCL